jgi:hypothetical protein
MSAETTSPPYPTDDFPAVSPDAYQEAAEIYSNHGHTNKFLEYYGFEPPEILHDWYNSYGQPRLPSHRFDPGWPTTAQYPVINIASMLELEQTHPGGVRELSVYNGLRNFARAPQPLLRYLCDNRTTPASRVILLASAFESIGEGGLENMFGVCGRLISRLPSDTALSCIEIGRALDLANLGRARVGDHGRNAKLHVAALSFHGDPEGGTLRRAYVSPSVIRQYDFSSADLKHLVTLMRHRAIPEATIVMSACSTGRGRNSIAKQTQRTTGHTVIAPVEDIYVSRLSLKENDEGILVPQVAYRGIKEHATEDKWVTYSSQSRIFTDRPKRMQPNIEL